MMQYCDMLIVIMQQAQEEGRGAKEQGSSAGDEAGLRGGAAAPTQANHVTQADKSDPGTPAASATAQVTAVSDCVLLKHTRTSQI